MTFGSCQCGKTFRSAIAEAQHRHNFPAYCQKKKAKSEKQKEKENVRNA